MYEAPGLLAVATAAAARRLAARHGNGTETASSEPALEFLLSREWSTFLMGACGSTANNATMASFRIGDKVPDFSSDSSAGAFNFYE